MKRRRKLTPKAMDQFKESVKKYQRSIASKRESLNKSLAVDLKNYQNDFKGLVDFKKRVLEEGQQYDILVNEFGDFLQRTSTEESETVGNEFSKDDILFRSHFNTKVSKIDELLVEIGEKLSETSSRRSSSRTSRQSTISKRAEANSAKVKADFAEKRATLQKTKALLEEEDSVRKAAQARKQTEIKTEFEVLALRENAAVAEAEAQALEDISVSDQEFRSAVLDTLPRANPTEIVATYVKENDPACLPLDPEARAFEANPESANKYEPAAASNLPMDITRFLMKKDLLLSRLSNFNDKPEFYRAWQSSFRSVVDDLGTNASEEIDLLIKYLGPESKRHAASLKTVYVSNPTQGLSKIWNRLDQQYGAPELVKHAVITKLNQLPKMSPKDPKKLYELVNILLEIQALKGDSHYAAQLAYFDSSEGILPVVHKLPYNWQEKWASRADAYKRSNNMRFPPLAIFVNFIDDLARMKNDPALVCQAAAEKSTRVASAVCKKTEVARSFQTPHAQFRCPIHKAHHSLADCKTFKFKSLNERKNILKEHRICYKCLHSSTHRAAECRENVKCSECGSFRHNTLMHENFVSVPLHGGERENMHVPSPGKGLNESVQSKCTQICGNNVDGTSCAKIVLVDVFSQSNPSRRLRTYAIIDEQSNRSLASPDLFDQLGVVGENVEYTLESCSGPSVVCGRKVSDCVVQSVDSSCSYSLPPLLECSSIPNSRNEIPTREIASHFPHLRRIAPKVPPLDSQAQILLLLGRDIMAAHHVKEQVLGKNHEPFAQHLGLGWVIIGQVCLGQMHKSETVNCKKTYLLQNGRQSLFSPCPNNLRVKENVNACLKDDIFVKTREDNEIGLSVEDRDFLEFVEENMTKDEKGHWVVPLPFCKGRPKLPNNREQAAKRATILHASLMKNATKLQHFVTFMDKIISKGHAEVAPSLDKSQECWYLPLFGVYHPKKPDQIRGVFDASAKYQGVSLNDVLLQGPDLINSLIGILLRFRREAVAVCADIEQMFYSFLVEERHRDFLRFFWYKENDPTKEMIEYRMRVHVFGNRPSPSVANFGLQKTATLSESEFGSDVKDFVSRNFYVDDGLTSKASIEDVVDLMKRTQSALLKNGNLRLHKIASNEERVLESFPQEDLAKDLAFLDLSKESMPVQRSLGLLWDLKSDCFSFSSPDFGKPFSRRGVLSVVNSLYDPLGFVAPVSIVGKILLKTMTAENGGWDDPLPDRFLSEWRAWADSLKSLKEVVIPRMYFGHSLSQSSCNRLLVFSDASEKAIASVAYLVSRGPDNVEQAGFVMGKAKVAPSRGHTIPRLELCAAVLSVEIVDFVQSQIDIEIHEVRYFTDSRVVLGYISNRRRRFYTYVANRVERILSSSSPSQWGYIDTQHNPADVGSRGTSASQMSECSWLMGPPERVFVDSAQTEENHPLLDPDQDKEIRPEVTCMATKLVQTHSTLNAQHFDKFSSLSKLTRAISNLQHVCRSYSGECQCSGWHICPEASSQTNLEKAQKVILRASQWDSFPDEILSLRQGRLVSKSSSLLQLNPFLDDDGLLRVGGRLKHSDLSNAQKNPIIVSGKSHIGLLVIRKFHEQVLHQGRHFTEGAIRAGGFWLTGGKRKISKYISDCIQCRKLRGHLQEQIMADLPEDRLTPAPPFTYVGVDVFGPWSIVTRKTRGGQSSNKRWAVLFTCLTIRAVHIELVEEMSSSAFINALRRFVAVRGNVLEFRSDRGTNFVGATSELSVNVVNVEDRPVQKLLGDRGITWVFNPPHASHMGGVWERMIGVVRKVLDSLLTSSKLQNLTHDVLATFMAEVCAIVNARPIVPVSADSEAPEVLSPSLLLTQKSDPPASFSTDLSMKDVYRSEWRRVQVLADQFWVRWRSEFLTILQSRQKWMTSKPDLKVGNVVLLRDKTISRNQWPTALVEEVFPSADSRVRSVKIKVIKDGRSSSLIRPISELVLLM